MSVVACVGMQYNWLSTLHFAARNSSFVKGVVLVDPLLPSASQALGPQAVLRVRGYVLALHRK